MHLIWLARSDLRDAFDLNTESGQRRFADWFRSSAFREYGISASRASTVPSASDRRHGRLRQRALGAHAVLLRVESVVRVLSRGLPARIRRFGAAVWNNALSMALRMDAGLIERGSKVVDRTSWRPSAAPVAESISGEPGVALIGYARAELGMGEHVRMSATALEGRSIEWGVFNFGRHIPGRQRADTDETRFLRDNRYKCNLFHINADQMLLALVTLGRSFFDHRYNIGYWAWELAHCPEEWEASMALVDELWAPSRFIQSSLSERAVVPVEYMPLCVSLPDFSPASREQLGLAADSFLFLFTFDFLSYVDRKNPYAAVRAFKKAFATGREQAGLVLKVMNVDASSPRWTELIELIDADPRISIINRTMDRHEVLQLFDSCNCFVSLHRSEGFGRGPAEAMCLGKPVILTNYSGTTDFATSENSCLVDFHLIPVRDDQYVFAKGQEWASPDEDHAAWHMRRLYSDPAVARDLGSRAIATIKEGFNAQRIGALYERRLRALNLV